ncbi:hypothetical protein [Streptomyces sp. NBC_00988]|uniref:hypothetical protein n=1 Tax=Streptomyces sp. NBC_00988 TaxID=2903704 RepID=UPI003864FBB3
MHIELDRDIDRETVPARFVARLLHESCTPSQIEVRLLLSSTDVPAVAVSVRWMMGSSEARGRIRWRGDRESSSLSEVLV